MATNRTGVAVGAIIALVLIVSLFSWSGMMGGWGSNANHGRSGLTIGVLVLVAVGIGGIVIWAIRKPRLH